MSKSPRKLLGTYVFEVYAVDGDIAVQHTLAHVGLMPRALPLLSAEELEAAARHINIAADAVGHCTYLALQPDTADLVPIGAAFSRAVRG